MQSYGALQASLEQVHAVTTEIEETGNKIKVPLKSLKLFAKILQATGEGKPISIVLVAAELTTQAAPELLGCSRPHLVGLLERGELPFIKIGKHRRVNYEDVIRFGQKLKKEQEERIIQMMIAGEASGLYESLYSLYLCIKYQCDLPN